MFTLHFPIYPLSCTIVEICNSWKESCTNFVMRIFRKNGTLMMQKEKESLHSWTNPLLGETNFYIRENEYKWHELNFQPFQSFFTFHDKPIIFIDLDRSLTPAPRESGRKSVPARKFRLVGGGGGRKREAISLIAAVKERKKRGNGTKTLHNHAVTPIKESSFPSNFSSLAAIFFFFFFIPSNSRKDGQWDLRKRRPSSRGSIRGEASWKRAKMRPRWLARMKHGPLLSNYCIIIVYCGTKSETFET